MFKSLFTPKWQHKDPNTRIQAIDALELHSDEQALSLLALTDPEKSVRKTALAKIADSKFLQRLLSEAKTAESWCEVATRIADRQPEMIEALKVQFGKRAPEWEGGLISAIKQCTNSNLAEQLLIASNRPDALLDVALSAKTIALKLLAVESITEIDTLQELTKRATHKQVLQVAKSQLRYLKDQQKHRENTLAAGNKINESLKELSGGKKDHETPAEYVAKVELLDKRWQSLDNASAEPLLAKHQRLRQACQNQLDSLEESLKKAELEEEANQSQTMVCEQLTLINEELSNHTLENIDSQKEAFALLADTWKNATSIIVPTPSLKGQHSALTDNITAIMDAWERFDNLKVALESHFDNLPTEEQESLNWLSDWNSLLEKLGWPKNGARPKKLDNQQSTANRIHQQVKQLVEDRNKKVQKLIQKINSLQGHIRRKNLIAANKLFNYLQFEKEKLDDDSQKRLNNRLESILVELEELRDWHAFATEPKKRSLCEEMESLIDSNLAPIQLAEKIHELQESWHELTSSDTNADHVLWDQFKSAADKAYLPCHAFYEEQDRVRSKNLKARIEICKELESRIASTDWNSSDLKEEFWKELDKYYSRITKDWKKHAPVPNNELKRTQARFGKPIEILKQALKEQKQKNLEARHQLIKKATKLVALEDINQAIDSAKKLQEEWKQTGLTFYKADKEAWQCFRVEVDKIFERRKQQKAEFVDSLKQNEELIRSLTKAINELSELDDKSLKKSKEKYSEIVQKWKRDFELPRKTSKQLIRAFEQSCESYIEHFNGIPSRERRKNIADISSILSQIQTAEIDNTPIEIEQFDFASLNLNENIKNALSERVKNISQSTNLEENKSHLESLLLQAEILLGIESPEEFRSERMEQQLNALQSGLGQSQQKVDSKWLEKFLLEWINAGATTPKSIASLNKRFDHVINAAI